MKAVRLSHTTRVPLPFEAAMRCFTPVGERDWVEDWDPVFPAGEHGDGDSVETVFVTGETTWVVVERGDDLTADYAAHIDGWARAIAERLLP